MPLLTNIALAQQTLATNHYGYSATRIDDLGATEYTLVSIVTDSSGSVAPFRVELEKTLKQIVQACQYSPRADNLMLRLVEFSDRMDELHGFKLLPYCNLADYDNVLHAGGATALYDAAENAISATSDYGKQLYQNDFSTNAIVFILTDGEDNSSKLSAKAVRAALTKAVSSESVESLISVLVGVNVKDRQVSQYLQQLMQDAGFTQYVELDKADAKTLARLAEFVSRSISAQSQSLGTGGPSQSLTF